MATRHVLAMASAVVDASPGQIAPGVMHEMIRQLKGEIEKLQGVLESIRFQSSDPDGDGKNGATAWRIRLEDIHRDVSRVLDQKD